MKKRVVKRILSTALAAAMIIGNVGALEGTSTVKAATVTDGETTDVTDGKTELTTDEIADIYSDVSYTAQSVHDPSIIKAGDYYYVFGSHLGVAKTKDLMNWESVDVTELFSGSDGNTLKPENAFTTNAYRGTITLADGVTYTEEGTASTDGSTADGKVKSVLNDGAADSEEETPTEETATAEDESEAEESTTAEEESEAEESTTAEEESEAEESMTAEEESEAEESTTVEEESEAEESTTAEESRQGTDEISADEAALQTVTADASAQTAEEAVVQESSEAEEEATVQESSEAEEEADVQESSEAEEEATVQESSEAEEEATVQESSEAEEVATVQESSDEEEMLSAISVDGADDTTAEVVTSDGTSVTVNFGSFDAAAWNTASDGWTIDGNMWAPDIIYNNTMNKYCMYLSLNGEYHNSVIILLTSDNIEGPYVYQGPIVYTGFTAQETAAAGDSETTVAVPTNWKNTDIQYVLGNAENTTLPDRYQKITNVTLDENGKITNATNNWGSYWPHAIDPAVFYDDNGKLWIAYGSWSGGIYMLELDENTGLRDYTVTYDSDYDNKGQGVTSDPYFGKKIAGGYYNSGEGPYIEKIGSYYYLFMSYGFYAPNGGYAMRIFRSSNPDGPYTDTNGISAIYDKGVRNFTADYGAIEDTRGMRLMSFYQWDHMSKGEVAQGHNSAIVDENGRAYVIYHTKFNDDTAAHEIRVHELFQNANGWIVASPFAYAGDDKLDYTTKPDTVTGDYQMIVHTLGMGYDSNAGSSQGGNYSSAGALEEIQSIALTESGTVTKDGTVIGSWAFNTNAGDNTPYATITLNGSDNSAVYSGVFAEVTKDSTGIKTMCFTGVNESTGESLWCAMVLEDKATLASAVQTLSFALPDAVYKAVELPSTAGDEVALYWSSSNTSVIGDDGTVVQQPDSDTEVTFTMTAVKGDYYYKKTYTITVLGSGGTDGSILVGKAFSNKEQELANKNSGSLKVENLFNSNNTAGLDFSAGASIEFDVKHTGTVNVLGALFAFNDNASGKLYFTQGSYLGYNATGGYYDANLNNYTLVKDYIGDAISSDESKDTAHVKIDLTADGFAVYVNDTLAYNQEILTDGNGNGAASLSDFVNVLEWLQNTATTMYLGYGAWWSDAVNAVISNMEFYVKQSSDTSAIAAAIASLKTQIPSVTAADIVLPATGKYDTTITWESDNTAVLTADGKVTLPDEETKVTLTATVSRNGQSDTVTFEVTVRSVFDVVIAELQASIPETTTESITLPTADTGNYGTTITWESSNESVLKADGTVILPDEATAVTLTATITRGSASKTATFIVTVKKSDKNVMLTKDVLEITSNDYIELIENPFYGRKLDGLYIDYDITMSADAAKNGWDGIFAFYNSTTGGRVSFQTNPYICYNPAGGDYLDINSPGTNPIAGSWEAEKEYNVHIELTAADCKMYVDGEEIALTLGGAASYADVLAAISSYNQFSWGVGLAKTAYWNTELCTLRNVCISSCPVPQSVTEEAALGAEPVIMSNPLYGENLKEVILDFTANFAEDAVLNGWDTLASFYKAGDAGVAVGRVSLQVAPYLCFNAFTDPNVWMDINSPGAEGADNRAVSFTKGEDYHFYISITSSEVVMKVNDETIAAVEASSGGVAYKDILDFISTCENFSWGAVSGQSSFWGTEKCTLKDAKVIGYFINIGDNTGDDNTGDDNTGDNGEETDQKVEVTFYYPDGAVRTESIEKGTVLKQPEYAVDENGRDILWYTDGTYETLYDFSSAVTEAISLYGRYYYYTVETGIRVSAIPDQQYTGSAIKPVITVYDGTTLLKEKVDYKVSYKNNKKVGTATVTITPMGNYNKAKKVVKTFEIVQRELTEENVTISYKPELNVKRNSKKAVVGQTEKVTVKYGKVTVPAKEYTVTYKKDGETVEKLTEAGDYQMIVAIKDNSSFKGTLTYDIVVTDKTLTSALKITAAPQSWNAESAKSEEGITTNITVTYKGKDIVPEGKSVGDIFDITYENNKNAGTASVTLKAKSDSDYCGSKTVTFKINGTAITKAKIEGFRSSESFKGEEITQNVTLVLDKGKATERTLEVNKDYTISYTNNVNAGKAAMVITGIGEFTGTVKKTFTIGKVNLKKAGTDTVVTFADSAAADGTLSVVQDKSGAKPAVEVAYKEVTLTEGTDYTVSYSSNKAVGTGKVTVKGIGNYTGTLNQAASFTITEKNIADASLTITAADLKYKANSRYKASIVIMDNGVKLSSKEYKLGELTDVVVDSETQCGTAQLTISGQKNYSGETTVTVQIRKNLLSSAKVTVSGTYYYDNGAEVSPSSDAVTVTIGSGKNKVTLTEGTDYTIVGCSNNTKAGKATLTIQGLGEYGGTKTVKYTILPKWMELN